jgi:histidinol-phosphate aminotransferase
MRPFTYGSTNPLVKYGGVAALKDTGHEAEIKQLTRKLREQTMAELKSLGYELIPSETNFFMVRVHRDAAQVGEEFRKRKVLVGRKFPPMNDWLRVSVGSEDEMRRFMSAFREIFQNSQPDGGKG